MKRFVILAAFLLAAAATPAWSQSFFGYATANANLRAGPATGYPRVATVPAGARLQIFGCLDGWYWCDVAWGPERGWMSSGLIASDFGGSRVVVYDNGPRLGLPFVTFSLGLYWDNYYRNRYWYRQRSHWDHYRPPPYHGRPPGYRPPHYNPPPGHRPPHHGRPPSHGKPPPNTRPPSGKPPPSSGRPPSGKPPPSTGRPPSTNPPPSSGRPPSGKPPPSNGRPPSTNPPPSTRPAPSKPATGDPGKPPPRNGDKP